MYSQYFQFTHIDLTILTILSVYSLLAGDVRRLTDGWRVAASHTEGAVLAVTAGLDQELNSGTAPGTFGWTGLPLAAQTSTSTAKALDRATRNTLRLKFASGLFENPFAASSPVPAAPADDVELARDGVRQGVVLLLNGQNTSGGTSTVAVSGGTLPLDVEALRAKRGPVLQVAVIGPNADGPDAEDAQLGGYGGGSVAPGATVTVVNALQQGLFHLYRSQLVLTVFCALPTEFGTANVKIEQGAVLSLCVNAVNSGTCIIM